jgi:hypothetical protein
MKDFVQTICSRRILLACAAVSLGTACSAGRANTANDVLTHSSNDENDQYTEEEIAAMQQAASTYLADSNLAAICFTKQFDDSIGVALRINKFESEDSEKGALTGPSAHHEDHINGEIAAVVSGLDTLEGETIYVLRNGKVVRVAGEEEVKPVGVYQVIFRSLLDDTAAAEIRDQVELATTEGKMLFTRCAFGDGLAD